MDPPPSLHVLTIEDSHIPSLLLARYLQQPHCLGSLYNVCYITRRLGIPNSTYHAGLNVTYNMSNTELIMDQTHKLHVLDGIGSLFAMV